MTAYDKEAADNGNRVTTKVIEGKATPHTASIDKGSEKPEKKQEKQSVFDKAKEIADKEEKKRKAEADKPKQKPLTEAERKDAEEVAGALGYRVEWVDTMEENGTIDADKKVIRIAKDAENPLVQVLGHEVAHGVKRMDGGKFKALQKAAMEVVGEKEWNERIEKKRKLNAYAEGKLAEEVTCDIVGEALNNNDALKRLAESLRGEKGILARLRDAVAKMVEYFKNRGDKEGVRRMKAADKLLAEFESALKEGVAPEQVKPEGVDRSVRESGDEPENKRRKDFAERFGVDESYVSDYANGMAQKNTGKAAIARRSMERQIYLADAGKTSKLSDIAKSLKSFKAALKEAFGDLDALIDEYRNLFEEERNMMEAARKKAEEEAAARKRHLDELSLLTDGQIDSRYAEALEKGDETEAREMLDEVARRKGYGDENNEYRMQHRAPSNPGYESDEARRNDIENGPDVNLEYIALGYNRQPDDYFTNPRGYLNDTPHGRESTDAVANALSSIRQGGRDVTVKVYRAVPTTMKEGKLRNGDWVSLSRRYAEMHGNHALNGKYRIMEDEVPAKDIWWDGNDVNEFGYDNGEDYKYKNVKNNRKSDDLVTRDDKGNVIPPSKRFNQRKADERYSRRESKALTEEERELRDNLVERMRKGGLDVVTDSEEMQRVIDTENERTRNMFVGEKGATEADKAEEASIRLDNLSVARRMEEAEKDAKAIKMATGWERGTDSKWRYETSDIKLKPFEEWMNKKNLKLGDIIDSDSGLFEMYPELKDFKVTRGKGKSTNAAIYTGLGKIEINFSKFKPYMSIPSNREKIDGILHRVINHEIQHAIQDSEGFAQGVSPNAFRPDAPIGKLREMEEADGRMVERYNAMSYTEKALGEGVRLKERILENRKEYNALASKYRFGIDGYTRAAGEVEARNTEKRIGMTEEERRASLASETEDVAREDQILLGVDNADGEQRFLRTADGEVYGLVKDGRIYLDPKVATAETAVHEYTHLWGDMLRRKDSEQWSHTVKELKNSVLWEEVKDLYPELKTDDEIADEVLSTFSGRRGAERLREEARRVADGEGGVFTKAKAIETLERVKEAIARFWEGVARMFGINRYRSVEELADMAMRDLLDSKNPMKDESGMRKRGEVGETLATSGTYFSGGGLLEAGLKGVIDPKVAVEFSEKIAGVYADNHGNHIVVADVRDVDPKKLVGAVDGGEVQYFHASPVCKNFSKAKREGGEVELDKETALSTAEFIAKTRPKVDVFSGKSDNQKFSVEREDGKKQTYLLKQGNEEKAGAKHSLYRHYGTNTGVITADDVLKIPQVLERGERIEKAKGGKKMAVYTMDVDGAKFTVYTRIGKDYETIDDFYSNKKGSERYVLRNTDGVNNTPEGAHNPDSEPSAKVEDKSESPKLFGEEIIDDGKKGSDSTDRSVRENPKNEDKPRYSRKPGESIFDYASRVSEDVDRSVRERVSARGEYEKKVKSKGFQTKEALQNSMLGLQEFMYAIDHASGNKRYIEDIPDFENPILGENRLSSVNKEEMHQVAKTQFKPLMSAVAKLSGNGKESGELYDYMFAKHGLERDAVMRQREAQKEFDKYQKANPKGTKTIGDFVASLEGKDYAGLTALTAEDGRVKSIQSQIDTIDEQMEATDDQLLLRKLGGQKKRLKVDLLNAARDAADDIRKAFESNPSHDRSDINELWKRVNEVNGNTLRKLYESGLLTKEAYNDISSMYTNYIPMRGFDQTTSADAYAYLTHGDSAFNAPIKTAKGRSSKADNPIAYMQAMAESAIMQGNRNVLVKQKMLNFVRNHPSDLASVSDVWLQYDSVADEWKPFYAFGRESKG